MFADEYSDDFDYNAGYTDPNKAWLDEYNADPSNFASTYGTDEFGKQTYIDSTGNVKYMDGSPVTGTKDNSEFGGADATKGGVMYGYDKNGGQILKMPDGSFKYGSGTEANQKDVVSLGTSLDSLKNAIGGSAFNKLFPGGTSANSSFLSSLLKNPGALLAGGAGLAALSGLNKPNRPPTGYQGGIPEYTASRAQLPIPNDPNRRPGQGGIRYMSDLQYLPKSAAPATTPVAPGTDVNQPVIPAAQGGLMGIASGKYLRGNTDGMADKIPASIGEHQPAKLSHGEFVIPADVVSHIGNGNSDAGAERLYSMMDKIRQARTGSKKQGKQINPDKFMPDKKYAAGGIVGFADGGTTLPAGTTGVESKLSSYVGPYVTDMLGKGQALANEPYQAYQGPLTAGASNLQNQGFGQAANLSVPAGIGQAAETAGGIASKAQGMSYSPITSSFDANAAQQYMNPYLKASLDPQIDEARRQSQITQMQNDAKMTGAGAFGGGRSAILNAETQRSLGANLANITGQGYNTAYNNAQQQFNADQARKAQEAQFGATYGLSGLNTALQGAQTQGQLGTAQNQASLGNLQALGNFGETQRGIESQGIAADKAAFEEERDRPYKQLQFQQSLLQGLPISSTQYNTADQSVMQQLLGAGSDSVALYKVLQNLGLADQTALTQKTPAATPLA
jgi:hypothetical protein